MPHGYSMSSLDWKLVLLCLVVLLVLGLLLFFADRLDAHTLKFPPAMTFTVEQPHGMRIEVRRCHPVGNTDESDDQVTCSCTVSDWIEDGAQRILVCEH
jgi:hypothetical protein